MIFFLSSARGGGTIYLYLETWGRRLRQRIVPLFYEELPLLRSLPRASYIFSDLERLSLGQLRRAAALHGRLAAAWPGARLLNDPLRTLRRLDLQTELHRLGWNRFAVRRLDGEAPPPRFPVFVRSERAHDGSLTPLLRDQAELDGAVAALRRRGATRGLLLVEFCDTVDAAGVFRTYSAFRIGDRLIPRCLVFGRHWVLKHVDLLDPDLIEEERRYLENFPHRERLREIFDRAHVGYGRIDYALSGEQIQTWEINTNPTVLLAPSAYAPHHLPAQGRFSRQAFDAFSAVDDGAPVSALAGWTLPHALAGGLLRSWHRHRRLARKRRRRDRAVRG